MGGLMPECLVDWQGILLSVVLLLMGTSWMQVLLQVNVGVDSLKDPILEILQFERHYDKTMALESDLSTNLGRSPCGELVKWLLPLDNSHQPVSRPMPSPLVNAPHKSNFSASTGSPLFSFGHFRSYSMSSLPQNTPPATSPPVSATASKPKFDLEDWDRFASHKYMKGTKTGTQDLMSFRGVPLEPERFSVCCGLEGIYIPGRRWRRKLEIIQPIDIHTFASDCNTDDLLCVQIKVRCKFVLSSQSLTSFCPTLLLFPQWLQFF
uniref:Uncharacterized protein n=1 Tax=Opuntia streptacantha TaxID=393608 RepID=A0A7C9CXG8_OPUST